MTTLHDFGGVLGRPFGHFLLGCHNFMVTALGSCVKWPLDYNEEFKPKTRLFKAMVGMADKMEK